MPSLINGVLLEGQTSHLEDLAEPVPVVMPVHVQHAEHSTANDNKNTQPFSALPVCNTT